MEEPSFYQPPEGMSEGDNVLRMVLSVVLVVSFFGLVIGWFASADEGAGELQRLPDCAGQPTSACVDVRAGAFEASDRAKEQADSRDQERSTHHFETADGERHAVGLEMSGGRALALEDEQVTGLFHDGELVGIESEGGRRFWTDGTGDGGGGFLPPLWFLGVAAVLVAVMVACVRTINRINATVTPEAIRATREHQDAAVRRGLRRIGFRR